MYNQRQPVVGFWCASQCFTNQAELQTLKQTGSVSLHSYVVHWQRPASSLFQFFPCMIGLDGTVTKGFKEKKSVVQRVDT